MISRPCSEKGHPLPFSGSIKKRCSLSPRFSRLESAANLRKKARVLGRNWEQLLENSSKAHDCIASIMQAPFLSVNKGRDLPLRIQPANFFKANWSRQRRTASPIFRVFTHTRRNVRRSPEHTSGEFSAAVTELSAVPLIWSWESAFWHGKDSLPPRMAQKTNPSYWEFSAHVANTCAFCGVGTRKLDSRDRLALLLLGMKESWRQNGGGYRGAVVRWETEND